MTTALAAYASKRQPADQQVILRIARDYFEPGELDELSAVLGKPISAIRFDYGEYIVLERGMLDPRKYGKLIGNNNRDDNLGQIQVAAVVANQAQGVAAVQAVDDRNVYGYSSANRIIAFYRFALTIDLAIGHMRLLDSYVTNIGKINTESALAFLEDQLPDDVPTANDAATIRKIPILRLLDRLSRGEYIREPDLGNEWRFDAGAGSQGYSAANAAKLKIAFKRSSARVSVFNMFLKLMARYKAAYTRMDADVFMNDDMITAFGEGKLYGSKLRCGPGMRAVYRSGPNAPIPANILYLPNGRINPHAPISVADSTCEAAIPIGALGARRRTRRRVSTTKRHPAVRRVVRRRTTSRRLPSLADLMSARTRRHRTTRRRVAAAPKKRTVHRRRVTYRAAVSSPFGDPAGLLPLGTETQDKLPFDAAARRRRRTALTKRRVVTRRPVHRVVRRASSGVRRYGAASILRAMAIRPPGMEARRRRRTTTTLRRRRPVVHRRRTVRHSTASLLRSMLVKPSVAMARRRRRTSTTIRRRRPTVRRTVRRVVRRPMRAMTVPTGMAARRRRRTTTTLRRRRPVVRRTVRRVAHKRPMRALTINTPAALAARRRRRAMSML
jgi:hypothetical protein